MKQEKQRLILQLQSLDVGSHPFSEAPAMMFPVTETTHPQKMDTLKMAPHLMFPVTEIVQTTTAGVSPQNGGEGTQPAQDSTGPQNSGNKTVKERGRQKG